ncbi:hypothetical protein FS837_002548 [Tulasnella sp. UAMH 9824]|nr:hypothetical protein FS837_002548 [Tulasnella sp. UAMH 9824]
MGYPEPEQRPVNFNDDDSAGPPAYDSSNRNPHRTPAPSTMYSMPGISRPVSGITAEDPFSQVDEYGQTRAESVAKQYRRESTGQGYRREDSFNDVDFDERSQPSPITPGYGKPQGGPYDSNKSSIYPYGASTDAITYIDENFNTYSSRNRKPEGGLPVGGHPVSPDTPGSQQRFQDMEYAEPYHPADTPSVSSGTKKSAFARFFTGDDAKYPLEQQIEAKRRGSLIRQKRPFVCWLLTAVMTGLMVYELVFNSKQQGTPFSMKPFVNPLLGPSQAALIEIGARYAPCMKLIEEVPPTLQMGYVLPFFIEFDLGIGPSNTANPPTELCTIEQLCAHGGFKGGEPNQWWRFISPIFLHAGLVHLLVNMFVQSTIAAHTVEIDPNLTESFLIGKVEREVGSLGFILIYFAAGIFGNVLGGNFALVGLPSVGASGALFGTIGTMWVDLFAHWRFEHRPKTKLAMLTVELALGIGLGFLPGTDNFAHLGGMCLGLLSSVAVYPMITETKTRATVVLAFRAMAIALAVVLYVVLIRNFYTGNPSKGNGYHDDDDIITSIDASSYAKCGLGLLSNIFL